jgi:hypothetical protein
VLNRSAGNDATEDNDSNLRNVRSMCHLLPLGAIHPDGALELPLDSIVDLTHPHFSVSAFPPVRSRMRDAEIPRFFTAKLAKRREPTQRSPLNIAHSSAIFIFAPFREFRGNLSSSAQHRSHRHFKRGRYARPSQIQLANAI